MIFPQEYKHVGVTHIHPDEDSKEPIYFLTHYMLVEKCNGNKWLYQVEHSGEGLLRKAESVDLITKPENIVSFPEKLNIKDRSLLIQKAAELCKNGITTVIFTGIDNHVTFVHEPDPSAILELEILDIAPPHPSWLTDVVRRLETSGIFGDLTITFKENTIDLTRFSGPDTVFPCSSSGLEGKCLDNDVIEKPGSLLVGCEISRSLFESRFPGLEYDFISLCPFTSDIVRPTGPFIARCCRAENAGQVTINGYPGATVHWGASEFDVANMIRELVDRIRKDYA